MSSRVKKKRERKRSDRGRHLTGVRSVNNNQRITKLEMFVAQMTMELRTFVQAVQHQLAKQDAVLSIIADRASEWDTLTDQEKEALREYAEGSTSDHSSTESQDT